MGVKDEVGKSIVPPPPAAPREDEVSISTWNQVRTLLRGTPSVARNLARVGRRSKASAHDESTSSSTFTFQMQSAKRDALQKQNDYSLDSKVGHNQGSPSSPIIDERASPARSDDRGLRSPCARHRSMAYCSPKSPGAHFKEGRDQDQSNRAVLDIDSIIIPDAFIRSELGSKGSPEVFHERHRADIQGCTHHAATPQASPITKSASSKSSGSDVTLHVYDLASWTKASSLPIFHLGVQVFRLEYFFCSRGIQSCLPAANKGHVFKESVPLGRVSLSLRQFRMVLQRLREAWNRDSYRIFGRNCQSFAIALCEELGLASDCIPAQYRRFSELDGLRNQVAGLVDGAASLLPRWNDEPSVLLSCAIPKVGSTDLCSQTESAPQASQREILGITGNQSIASIWFEDEEPIPDSAHSMRCNLPKAVTAAAGVGEEAVSAMKGLDGEEETVSWATKTRKRPESRGGG